MDIKLHYPISVVVAPFYAARSININFHPLKGRKLEISQVLEFPSLAAKLRGFHSVQRCVVVSSLPGRNHEPEMNGTYRSIGSGRAGVPTPTNYTRICQLSKMMAFFDCRIWVLETKSHTAPNSIQSCKPDLILVVVWMQQTHPPR